MPAALPRLPTSIVGSLPQPGWLIDRDRLAHQFPPRVRARELWRVAPEVLQRRRTTRRSRRPRAGAGRARHRHRRRDAAGVLLQPLRHGAGRASTSTPRARCPTGRATAIPVPRVVGGIGRPGPIQIGDVRFLRAQTDRDDQDHRAGAVHDGPAVAGRALRRRPGAGARLRRRRSARRSPTCSRRARTSCRSTSRGCRPGRRSARSTAWRWSAGRWRAPPARRRAPVLRVRRDGRRAAGGLLVPARAGRHPGRHDLGGDGAVAPRPRQLRPLRGKGIALGVLDLSTPEMETPEVVADRVRRALDDVDVDRLVLSSDCGLKYLPRASAEGKMRSLAVAAGRLREELG